MPSFSKQLPQMFVLGLLGGLAILSGSAPAAGRGARKPATTFKLGKVTFTGQPKTICVIEGKWSGGEYFRYEAWDGCSQMHLRRVNYSEYKDAQSLGTEKSFSGRDIPAGAEVIEVTNGQSSVLLFRDRSGTMREIMSAD